MTQTPEHDTAAVLFSTLPAGEYQIGVATLNSPKSLNSLSVDMVDLLTPQLETWQRDESIVAVWLDGAGEKAFCAGGDIRRLYDTMISCGDGVNTYAEQFFANEYRLDYLIHRYRKPLVVWGHGIVMGGGIGLLSGASHRVVTEQSRFAMPEINIGLYPDVGGTWFLNHAPGRTGLFLGLTGAHINAADALFVGLADRCLPAQSKARVLEALQAAYWSGRGRADHAVVTRILREYETQTELPASPLRAHFDLIQRLTDADDVTQIAAQITGYEGDDPWLTRAAKGLANGCPTTAHLVYEQLQRGKKLSLEAVFRMELIMSLQCARHPDFPEGVRALLVDKDGKPQWQHASVAEVPQHWVDAHFTAPWGDAAHPLADLGEF